MNVVKEIGAINKKELENNLIGKGSWHDEYKDSAYIFVGGLPFDFTEGDVITVFSQYGEIMDINLVKDQKTGKSKGFAFLAYQDQRSTVLAVDNFNGAKVLNRTLRVDHVKDYKKKGKVNDDGVEEVDFTYNAAPKPIEEVEDSSEDEDPELSARIAQVDLEDPMAPFLIKQIKKERKKELKKSKKKDSKSKKKDKSDKKENNIERNLDDKDLFDSNRRNGSNYESNKDRILDDLRSPPRNRSRSKSPISKSLKHRSRSPPRHSSEYKSRYSRYTSRSPSPYKSSRRQERYSKNRSRSPSPIRGSARHQSRYSRDVSRSPSPSNYKSSRNESKYYRSRSPSPVTNSRYESKYTRSLSRSRSPLSSPKAGNRYSREVSLSPSPKRQLNQYESRYPRNRSRSRSPVNNYSKNQSKNSRDLSLSPASKSDRRRSRSPYRSSKSKYPRDSSPKDYRSKRDYSHLPNESSNSNRYRS